MRSVFLIYGLMLSAVLFSQTDTLSVTSFEVVKEEPVATLPLGSFLFKTDQDYYTYLSSINETKAHPVFFGDDEMGLIINVKNHSRGLWREVEKVTETNSKLYVNLVVRKDYYLYVKPEEHYQQVFIRLKKTNKEVIVLENNEGIISGNHLRVVHGNTP